MNKEERMTFVERKINQNRYLLKFNRPVTLNPFVENSYIKETIDVINFNQKDRLEVAVDKTITKEQLFELVSKEYDLEKDSFEIVEKSQGLSNLFPL
ncbi:hypothetical protein IGI37_001150 [Enterococcus sp. AZ194]|uniref:hypothetical protein n=1 Tax=Enterococcus sp. AZ194 TaxID=2774629 RepID=UPI003F211FDF